MLRYVPAAIRSATSTVATLENRRKADLRRSGASGSTTTASCTSPPIHRHAAERWTQSASSDFHDAPASAAEWPESESPDANPSPSRKAGNKKTLRSVSHDRKSSAVTSAKPSV